MPRLQQVLRNKNISSPVTGDTHHTESQAADYTPTAPEHLSFLVKPPPDQDKTMLWAAFTTCFFGFMRSEELCIQDTTRGFDETTNLTFSDVAVDDYQNPSLLRIHLKTSKTDSFCKGTDIMLGRTNDELCPVAALLQWMVQRGNAPGPLFKFASGALLTRPRLVVRLHTVIQQVGSDPSGFSGHSFRSGAATTAAQLWVPDSQIKLLGRWKSNAFLTTDM